MRHTPMTTEKSIFSNSSLIFSAYSSQVSSNIQQLTTQNTSRCSSSSAKYPNKENEKSVTSGEDLFIVHALEGVASYVADTGEMFSRHVTPHDVRRLSSTD